jgi:hypothetical protein
MRIRLVIILLALVWGMPAHAVPSFARQTGMACEACHTVFPELTHFGRTFKANGYVLDNLRQVRGMDSRRGELLDLSQTPPISIMVQASDTQLSKGVPDTSNPAVAARSQNGTVAFPQQVSIFYAGKIAPRLGGFLQLTYGNDSGSVGIDNVDLRFADLIVLPNDRSLVYGISLNNNPTLQDLWNTTPAFGFPYQASNAAVSPIAAAQIDGTLGQSVAGISAYLYWNESLYVELGGYRSAPQGAVNTLTQAAGPLDGANSNVISGLAPYWRVAYEYSWGRHSLEAGAYGLDVNLFPGAVDNQPAPLQGLKNEFRDVAEDLQYQFLGDEHLFTVTATRIHESMTLNASFEAESVEHASNDLTTTRLALTYYYRRKFGGTLGFFSTKGSTDTGLYFAPAPDSGDPGVVTSAASSPDTHGWIAEVNYVPWLNTKFTLQYTAYSKFNGGGTNYDGVGRNASDNDTLYALIWFAY